MASLLTSHLSQISLCATSIAELPFPGPKRFTNALLNANEITSLIRDTEQHERALFHLAPPPLPSRSTLSSDNTPGIVAAPQPNQSRRATMYGGGRQTPRNKAVAAVLGGDLYQRTRREGMRAKGDVDVEVLLEGAERLLNVYAIPGANESISHLRRRYEQLRNNIAYHEQRVAKQSEALAGRRGYGDVEDEDEKDEGDHGEPMQEDAFVGMSADDMEAEEKEIRELEAKKKALEERVAGMEKDLGGLMR
ncbi:uncharacterized protein RCC_00082 [Ramularia collo-cygni]|uniref:DASH complex subunit SPC34 n=1 Tax=Ramularia collo-cygni TaxID=112498 RepID=A0A2D3URK9_9PEZI|nr:uncharacterized protein RCC_00082 [Ramularia collo-cygni]CZT14107.1 uncharacterized protein RCC_00082 [Ramularia collo-cygni]